MIHHLMDKIGPVIHTNLRPFLNKLFYAIRSKSYVHYSDIKERNGVSNHQVFVHNLVLANNKATPIKAPHHWSFVREI